MHAARRAGLAKSAKSTCVDMVWGNANVKTFLMCHIFVALSVLILAITLFVEQVIVELDRGLSLWTLVPMGLSTIAITACMVWLFLGLVNLLDIFLS